LSNEDSQNENLKAAYNIMTTTAHFNTSSTRFLAAVLLCSSFCLLDVGAADSPAKTGNLRTLASTEQVVDIAPMLQDEVEKALEDRPALAKLPDANIELARFFDRNVDIRYDEKTGALVIESKLTLDPLAEAPSIPGDMLDPHLLADASFVKQFMKSEFEGSIPDHLAFSVKPTIV
jgi:hypothetical protein